MPDKIALIGFKAAKPAAQADEKSENTTYYFHYTYDDAAPLDINDLKLIVYLLTQTYPMVAFATVPENVNHTLYQKGNSLEAYSGTLTMQYNSSYEIHAGLRLPTPKVIAEMAEPTITKTEINPVEINESILRAALQRQLLRKKITRLNLSPEEKEINFRQDELFFTPFNALTKNKEEIDSNDKKLKAIQQDANEILKLIEEIQQISPQSAAECKEPDDIFIQQSLEANKQLANISNNFRLFIGLQIDISRDFDREMKRNELRAIRLKLIQALCLCALDFFHKEINDKVKVVLKNNLAHFPAIENFNTQFSQIATAEINNFFPVLHFNKNVIHLNFSELQTLVNDMLEKFYTNSSWSPLWYGYSYPKTAFVKYVTETLSDYITLDIEQNTFTWQWEKLHALLSNVATLAASNQNMQSELDKQREALDKFIEIFSKTKAEFIKLKERCLKTEKTVTSNQSYLSESADYSEESAGQMLTDYLAIQSQINLLQQTLQKLLISITTTKIPFSTLATLIDEVEKLQIAIGTQQAIMSASTDADKTTAAVDRVKELRQNLDNKKSAFQKGIAPLTELVTLTNSMETILNSQNSRVTAQDKLIDMTCKFANLLNDVNYFSSQVKWGGISLTIGGVTHQVPESYFELFEAKNKLIVEPLDCNTAMAFWSKAKEIQSRAELRSSYRFFFYRVRSKEMSYLHALIREFNILNPSAIESQLDNIKPDWLSNQLPGSLPVKSGVAFSASSSSSSASSSSASFFNNSASQPVPHSTASTSSLSLTSEMKDAADESRENDESDSKKRMVV